MTLRFSIWVNFGQTWAATIWLCCPRAAAAISWEFGIWLTGRSGKEDGQCGQDNAE